MTNTNEFDGPLPILISARIRLNHEQRLTLKNAYAALRKPQPAQPVLAGATSTLRVETQFSNHAIDHQVGMSQLTFSDLVNSRDTISLPVLLELQRNLGVVVVTKEDIQKASEGYIEYTFNKFS